MIKPKKTLQDIFSYKTDNYYHKCKFKLDSNENSYGPAPGVIEAIKNFPLQKIKFYPAYGELIDALSIHLNAKPDCFLLTNGCDEAINVIFNTYLEPDDEVLSFSPTFSMPILYSKVIGAKFVEIDYNMNFEFEYDVFCSKITSKTKILYLTSPNNPTGGIIKLEIVEKIAKNYPDKLVILDCTYLNFANADTLGYFNLVKQYENIAVLKSFSKDFALAGLRLGYIYANEEIINEAKKIISPYSVNAVAIAAGLAAIKDLEFYKKNIQKLNDAKFKLAQGLNDFGYETVVTDANFILCNFGSHANFIYKKLLNNGIRIKRFKQIKGFENTFRITAPKLEDVPEIIDIIRPRPIFVFDLDGVVFDVKNSYRLAIKKTFEHFTGYMCEEKDIQLAKNTGGLSNDWDLTLFLINKAGFSADYNELVKVFQNYFYIPQKGGYIDNETVILNAEFFEKLSKFADCAVFTGRPCAEAFYSLEKAGIKKYFSYFICNEDVNGNYKPSPYGLEKIKTNCSYSKIYYFGDTIDDINAGKSAGVPTFGVIPDGAPALEETISALINSGACGIIKNKNEILEAIYANG